MKKMSSELKVGVFSLASVLTLVYILFVLDPDYFYNRGVSYHALEKYEDALKDYDKAIELDPKDPENFNGRGNSLDLLGKEYSLEYW